MPNMLWIFIVVLIPFIRLCDSQFLDVPGCPSIVALNSGLLDPKGPIPSCFCDNATEDTSKETGGVEISCIVFGRLDNLTEAVEAVQSDGRNVWLIHLSSARFDQQDSIPKDFFKELDIAPRRITITDCMVEDEENMQIHPDAFAGLENSLERLEIRDCALGKVPTTALSRLKALQQLHLSANSISRLHANAFQGLENVNKLVLSDNEIEEYDPDCFKGLEGVENFVLGPTNGFPPTLFSELNSLYNLKTLDLSSMGLSDIPPNAFRNITSKLEVLSLIKNDLTHIREGSFNGLSNLSELDIRVNLVSTIESGAFEPLVNLKNLKLAGNFLDNIDSGVLRGLTSLEKLDLGFNEFQTIPANTFIGVPNLKELDLQSNTQLAPLDNAAFRGLGNLITLNMTRTGLKAVDKHLLKPLKKLEALSLDKSRMLTTVDPMAFAENTNLQFLDLSQTEISTVSPQMFATLPSLKLIDVSRNPWICDDTMGVLIGMMKAKLAGGDFLLLNINQTLCAHPPGVRGAPLVALDPSVLQPYDPALYTTTPPPTTTTTTTTPKSTAATTPTEQHRQVGRPGPGVASPGVDSEPAAESGPTKAKEAAEPEAEPTVSRTTLAIAITVIILAAVAISVIVIVVIVLKKKKQTQVFTEQPTMTYKAGKNLGEEDIVRQGKLTVRPPPDGATVGNPPPDGETVENGTVNGHSEHGPLSTSHTTSETEAV